MRGVFVVTYSMKFKNLLLDPHENLLEELLESCRQQMNLSSEDFKDFLRKDGQKLYNTFDEGLIQLYIEQINKNLVEKVLKANAHNQKEIISENEELFIYFLAYIDAVYRIYNSIIHKVEISTVEVKDITIISLYGILCRNADQIAIMLNNGYTDGALKLWRSFYEYAVITVFLCKHNSNDLAERFTNSSLKTSKKKAESYQKRHESLKFPEIDSNILTSLTEGEKEIDSKYEKEFLKDDYSWAKGFVNDKKINFRTLEEYVEMDRFRMFYIWASEYSHANASSFNHFRDSSNKIVLERFIIQDIEKNQFKDPMQLTLSVFDHVNISFLELYCDESEHNITIQMLRKIYQKLQDKIH